MNVYYHGQPYSGLGYTDGGMGFQNNNGNLVCWTATEPFGSRNWWPCKDTPEDKADSVKLWIECPSNMTAVTNGVLQSDLVKWQPQAVLLEAQLSHHHLPRSYLGCDV